MHIRTAKSAVSPGDEVTIYIYIDNSKSGHKMPSGSADLRQLWLELAAYKDDEIIPIPALPATDETYSVAGKGPFDEEILGQDIPKGSRVYRAIYVDKADRQTLSSYDAVKIVFDNRLNAGELRKEAYYFKVPQDVRGKITLKASLNYLPYPSSFSGRFGLPGPEPFKVTSSARELEIK